MLIDSHAHIDGEEYSIDRADVIQRAIDSGVTRIINIGADMKSSAASIRLAEQYDCVYALAGIHPEAAANITDADYQQLADWMSHSKVKGVGEIGLDYHYEIVPREEQKQVLIRQLDIARQLHVPVCVHDREAHGDMMEILKKEGKGIIGVMHCFSGSQEMANELIKMGWYLGVDGPLTFKNAAKLPEIVANVPLENLLVETDSPYMAPVPMRGKRNEPAFVRYVAERAAALRKISLEKFARVVTANTCRLYKI